MRRRSDKLSHAAHVKRSTRGTSNEISFSVLDAARNALDEGKEKPTEQAKRFGRIHLFTLPIGRRRPPSTPVKDQVQALTGSLAHPTLPASSKFEVPDGIEEHPVSDAPLPSTPLQDVSKQREQTMRTDASEGTAAGTRFSSSAKNSRGTGKKTPATPFELASRSSGRTSEEEIAWRKGRRRKRRLLAAFVSTVLLGALIAAGGWYLHDDNLRYEQNLTQMHEAEELVASTDELLLSLDEVLQDPLGDSANDFREQRADEVEQGMATLSDAEEKATNASRGLRTTSEREAADNLMVTCSARHSMLESGWNILQTAQTYTASYDLLEDAWQNMLDADEAARDAADLVSQGDRSVIEESKAKTQEAIDLLTEAQASLAQVANASSYIDVSAQQAYVDKRLEALGYALASNEALEVRDTQTAIEQNDAYNKADEEAADLVDALPEQPTQPAVEALQKEASNSLETYEAARGQVSSSDAFLRDYFGSSGK